MNVSPDTMRALLVGCMAGMALLAGLYLRRRELSPAAYFMWGLLILVVPLLGPFLVILSHPGRLHPRFHRLLQRHFTSTSLFAAAARRLHSKLLLR